MLEKLRENRKINRVSEYMYIFQQSDELRASAKERRALSPSYALFVDLCNFVQVSFAHYRTDEKNTFKIRHQTLIQCFSKQRRHHYQHHHHRRCQY